MARTAQIGHGYGISTNDDDPQDDSTHYATTVNGNASSAAYDVASTGSANEYADNVRAV